MGFSKKQLADARALYKRRGNRLSWPECIAKATKGGATKKTPAKVAGKKKPVKRTVSVKKRVTVNRQPVNIKISGTTGVATAELVRVQRDIENQQQQLDAMKGKSIAGMGAADKKQHRTELANRKKFIQDLKRHRTAVKRSIK